MQKSSQAGAEELAADEDDLSRESSACWNHIQTDPEEARWLW